MKFFALKNLSSDDVETVDPTTATPLEEYPESKKEFREWCTKPTTEHCFYSAVEGITPSLRVSKQNPAHLMHGLVLDYDTDLATEDIIASIPTRGEPSLLPMWSSKTYSGHARLVYVFEEPILCDNEEITQRFLKQFSKEAKLENLLPSLDKGSFNQAKYFELGRSWKPVEGGKPINADRLGLMIFNAAKAKQIKGEGMQIPIEDVAAEVEKQFQGRWPGEFKVGSRGPLFWVEPFVDRVGCQVGDWGIICYSERAGKSFMTWGEILGHAFVQKYEAERIGNAAKNLWFDGKNYWRRNENGRWYFSNKEDAAADLRCAGISGRLGKGTATEVDLVLNMVRNGPQKVDGAVPFIHDTRDLVQLDNGYRYLNISCSKTMAPADQGNTQNFPWLHKFFENSFDPEYPQQKDYFLAWLKHFYESAFRGNIQPGQAVIIAGEADRGKTFLSRFIIGNIMGGFADAGTYLLGETHFNKSCAEHALWCIDDSKGSSTWDKHDAFSAALKKHVANPTVQYHPKFRDAFEIPWKGRIIVTCNTDGISLTIIPTLNATIADKLMLFKLGDWHPKFWANPEFESSIRKELPYFLAWLLNWNPPEYTRKDSETGEQATTRFAVGSFRHPDLVRASHEASSAGRLEEMLGEWRKVYSDRGKHTEPIWMTATQLRSNLSGIPGFESSLREFGRNKLAQDLRALGTDYILESRVKNGYREYLIKVTET